MIRHDDDTPVDPRSPLELILDGVNATRDCQLQMYEDLKAYRAEIESIKGRIKYPVATCVVSALVCLASAFVRLSP